MAKPKHNVSPRASQPLYLQQAHAAIDSIAKLHNAVVRHCPKFLHSVWTFPIIVGVMLLTLTVLRISGSSVGVYSQINGTPDSHAIAGNPRGVRSDEWLVTTQLTVAQAVDNYPKVNQNIADGQNMNLLDVPAKDWTILFKPQNLVFLVLPLEFAFAFKWWFLIAVLVLACYFFVLEVAPGRKKLATLFAIFMGLSPFVFWWWVSGTLLTIGYGFLLTLLVMRLIKAQTTKTRLAYSGLLTYVLICFALLLYPPFQIACMLAVAAFLVGWVAARYKTWAEYKTLFRLWPYAAIVVGVSLVIGLAFYQTNKDVISKVSHTVYPGTRVEIGGGVQRLLAFSSFLTPNLQDDTKAAEGYFANQSEASNFILIAPFLVLPSLYLIVRERRTNKRTLWALLCVNLMIIILLIRMYIPIPALEPLSRLLLLDKVPSMRLLIGLGLLGVFQLLLIAVALQKMTLKKAEAWGIAVFGACSSLAAMLYVGAYTIHHYHAFIASTAKVVVFALWIAVAIFLVLRRHIAAALVVLIGFSLLAVYRVDPLYQGLSPLTNSAAVQAIKSYPDQGSWIVLDDRLTVNFPLLADKDSLSGVQFAPQLKLWKQLDPKGQYAYVYNRYAHVMFTEDSTMTAPFVLKYADLFVVKFDSCSPFIQKNVRYVLSPKQLTGCVKLDQTITTPAKQSYIYEISPVVIH